MQPHWELVPVEGEDPATPTEVYAEGFQVQLSAWPGWAKVAKKKLDALTAEDAEIAA